VARDRRRAKQRRDRQARAAGGAQARRAEAAAAAREPAPDAEHIHDQEPAELASGEVDLADAQLALGRPELADSAPSDVPDVDEDTVDLPELADEERFEQLEDEVDAAEERFEAGFNGSGEAGAEVVERAPRAARKPVRREEGNRFANFLRGSWRELERVQWPDRRSVAQATAVVIGFVIVAGAFLGLMDYLASKIVDLIV
jgi:preprotein translocase SecE subunit